MSSERTVTEAGRLDTAVAALWPEHSRAAAARVIKAGGVTVDGQVVHKPSTTVSAGAVLTFDEPEPIPMEAEPEDLPVVIVYQDADIAVIDKAPGMVVHPGAGHHSGTLVNALLHHLDDLSGIGGALRPGIVHRLDKGTSGLLVIAKNDRAHRSLAAQFADHSARRTYLALCVGDPREDTGTIQSTLGRHPKHRVRFASVEGGKHAVTHWQVEARFGTVCAIAAQLETGRTHQIRVHFSEAGWPLIGDPLYGNPRIPKRIEALVPPERTFLHARKLELAHPDGRSMSFEAPIPPDMQRVLDALEDRG